MSGEYPSEAIEVQLGPRAAGLLQIASTLPLMSWVKGSEQLQVRRLISGYRSFRDFHG